MKIPDTEEKDETVVEELAETREESEKIENVEDFLNDIKSAANQAVLEQNFIYEPTSGKPIRNYQIIFGVSLLLEFYFALIKFPQF